jgi:TIR domain
MTHDVFISYPHQNKTVADAACAKLEAAGIRCWIAPRDIAPSAEWAASIVEGIDLCRVMVLIFSAHANASKQVHREVQHAFDGEKPVVPFRLEDVPPLGTMRFYMSAVHWLDALTPPLDQHLERLVGSVAALVGSSTTQPTTDTTPPMTTRSAPNTDTTYAAMAPPVPTPSGYWLLLKIAVAALLTGIVAGWTINAGFYAGSVERGYGHLLSVDRALYTAMILLVMDALSVRLEAIKGALVFIILYLIYFSITFSTNWAAPGSDIVGALGTAARLVVSWIAVAGILWPKGVLKDVRMLMIAIAAGSLQGLVNVFIGKILAQDLNYEVTEGLVFFTTAVTLSYGIRRWQRAKFGHPF